MNYLQSFMVAIGLFLVSFGSQESEQEFNPRTLIRKPFPAIKNVESFAANSRKLDLEGEELVLGVEINGHARAYPINMLKGPTREIVNDNLGGKDIAATW